MVGRPKVMTVDLIAQFKGKVKEGKVGHRRRKVKAAVGGAVLEEWPKSIAEVTGYGRSGTCCPNKLAEA